MRELISGLIGVFADEPLAGNPLAVVQAADELSEEQMRRIAGEFNQAETTFILESTRADRRLRSFTASGAEVLGTGHNALGAWLWLGEPGDLGPLSTPQTFCQEIGTDVLPIELEKIGGWVHARMRQAALRLLVLMVVVMDASTPESKPERRRFTTMPSDLRRLLLWLREQGVEEAAMESTAQYWRSVWLELEPYMRLQLAQAFPNRASRGRKHDFKDAERLMRRLIADELILSFVPAGEQRTWHNLTRMKLQLTHDQVRLQSQMECLLEEMRIKLRRSFLTEQKSD